MRITSKRKRDLEDFDHNKSDPEDENFDPTEVRPRKEPKKPRSAKGSKPGRRNNDRYRGPDIVDDEDESSDSEDYGYSDTGRERGKRHDNDDDDDDDDDDEDDDDDGDGGDDDDDEDDNAPLNASGRRKRKAAVKSYRESSTESIEETDADADADADAHASPKAILEDRKSQDRAKLATPASRRMVKLKVSKPILAQTARRTRANASAFAEVADDFVELSTSGRRAVASRDSRSKSPEAFARSRRSSRATKGLKKAPEPIAEATQESTSSARSHHAVDADDLDELSQDLDFVSKPTPPHLDDERMEDLTKEDREDERVEEDLEARDHEEEEEEEAVVEQGENGEQGQGLGQGRQAAAEEEEGDLDTAADRPEDDATAKDKDAPADYDDEDDDVPTTRRTRLSRLTQQQQQKATEEGAGAENGNGEEKRRSRRLTKKTGVKKMTEPSSDFDPGDDSDGEGSGSDKDHNMDDDEDVRNQQDSPTSGPSGRQTRQRGRGGRTSRRRKSSPDEDPDIDMDELSEEARQLRQSSRQRRRTAGGGGGSPIAYEKRRKRQDVNYNVNYYMPPLNAAAIEEEVDEPAVTPSRNRRRGGAAPGWDRSLNTTFGPFGGGGGGSILGGPWGTGATGGVESDSSDDEMMHRSNAAAGGNVGMTPTSAVPPGGLVPGIPGLGLDGPGGAAPNLGKIKDRKALADADPLGVDLNVDFSKVGGLQGHIDQLKEMVQLPLLYPELFTRFHVTPPRGVLFHGPPGTGKTLLARALANSVGSGGQKISFYMRKGADALSKWVGEAEKQLRLLFEEARKTQPSIIFFDEIDGLAPVRSSKQEQIHASIVSTLLALMDGMDGRGQVIVIGATNRPDNIDPALRRPGRFDREFYFPLPDLDGRRAILDIHTQDWGLPHTFKTSLAENTKGYGGADLRALCTEAALNAIQRSYPQIYSSKQKLLVDAANIRVHASDFMISVKKMIPSSERSATSGARPLPASIAPLLRDQLAEAKLALEALLPRKKKITALEEAMFEQFDDADHGFGREALHQEFERSRVFRPRFIILGPHGMGQGYLASAILHHFEGVHVQNFDLPSLLGDGRPMEQVIVGLFTEVRRHKPSVIYIPNMDAWYATLTGTIALITFQTMLKSIPPTDPVLLLATADATAKDLPDDLLRLFFGFSHKNRMEIQRPRLKNRMEYFSKTLEYIQKKPADFPDLENRKKRILEELPLAPALEPKIATKEEMKAQKKKDHQLLNALKIQLQPIMDQINRRYRKFRQPVIAQAQIDYLFAESDPHYVRPDIETPAAAGAGQRPFEVVKDKHGNDVLRDTASGKCYYNLETTTIEERLSNGFYARPMDFLFDIKSLAKDAKNFGDKERILKANELLSNVEVDVASIENSSAHVDWEALYQRQQQRARDAAEKARQLKAMQSVLESVVESDLVSGDVVAASAGAGAAGAAGHSQGALILGEPTPSRTTARFMVRSPISNGHGHGHGHSHNGKASPRGSPRKNGVAQESKDLFKDDDAKMSGVDEDSQPTTNMTTTDGHSHASMGPPPRFQIQSQSQSQSQGARSTAAAAGASQVSQRSALTSLPSGVSPSAVFNEASTTKSSELGSSWSNPPTHHSNSNSNGQRASQDRENEHDNDNENENEHEHENEHSNATEATQEAEMPDTLLNSQLSFNESVLQGTQSQGTSPHQPTPRSHVDPNLSGSHRSHPSPLASRAGSGPGSTRHVSDGPGEGGQSQQDSQNRTNPSSQPLSMDVSVDGFLAEVTHSTSGCSIEQLEQVNREMMDEIWRTRHEWNRTKVLGCVTSVFNNTMADIESMQKMDQASQGRDSSL